MLPYVINCKLSPDFQAILLLYYGYAVRSSGHAVLGLRRYNAHGGLVMHQERAGTLWPDASLQHYGLAWPPGFCLRYSGHGLYSVQQILPGEYKITNIMDFLKYCAFI